MDLQGALNVVCDWLARLGDGVYVLAPPGSGRRGLARCLAGRGFKVFVPRGYGVEAAKKYRDVEDLTRRLEEARGPIYVVVNSSWEAVELVASLPGRLRLVYLPALYGELLVEGRRRGLAWVSHGGLCTAYEGRVVGGACEGPAPGLLSLSPAELEAGVEALETLRRTRKNLGEVALRLLLDAAGVISPFGGVATAVKAIYDFFQGAIRQRYGEVASLLKFVEVAEKTRAYVRRLEFEALVDSVALEWGLETGRFKILVEALGDPSLVDWLAHGRHVESLSNFGRVYARYNAEELGVTEEYVIEAGMRYPLAKKVFVEKAKEVMRLLGSNKAVVLKGPRGVGKSTLAKYVAYAMLMQEQVDYVLVPEGPVNVNELLATAASLQRRVLLLFDVHPREVYMPRFLPGAVEGAEKPLEAAAKAVNSLLAAAKLDHVGRLRVLLTASDDELKTLDVELDTAAKHSVDLSDVEFLAEVVRSYMGERAESCQGVENLARIIKEHHPKGAYTLVAKYAGLWLRGRGCDVSDVEKAVEETKKEPKLFFAHYIWQVLLRGSSDLARRAAAPLLLHAHIGPVPVGVTYVTKAVKNGVWRFLKPEELEGFSLESLREDALEPIARWLAQRHEDLVEETLRDLAGLNGEETREPYREALRDLIKALNWARDEVLKEGGKILAELGIPEERRGLETALLAFVARRLAAVFKSDESRRCWERVALIADHALAGYPVLSRGQLPEDVSEALGNALKPCAVDDYLTIDGETPPLSILVVWFLYYVETLYARDLSRIRRIRERLGVLTPYADADIIEAVKETAKELMKRWRKRGFNDHETFYALGLAALAAEGEVDKETVDLLLRVASAAVQRVVFPAAVMPILAALRSLGEKAPHRYVSLLATALELEALDQETVEYIYDVLQQLRDRLETGHTWPLVNAVIAYSNLLRKHSAHIKDRWKDAVADMCRLYGEVRKRDNTTAPESGLSAQRLFNTIAKAYVLAAALRGGRLTPLVQRYCGLGDLEKETKDVMFELNKAAASPEELKKIMENDKDFADWVRVRDVTEDAERAIEDLRAQLTYVLAHYKLNHAFNERGELDEKKLEEAAEEFEMAAEISRKLKQWENYLTARSWALRTRVLAAKSWKELLKRAEGFRELWREAEEYSQPTARYLETAALILGEYLVYLAASCNKEEAVKLLKERQWLLDYDPQVFVATLLMLRLLVVDVFKPEWVSRPASLILTSRLQKDKASEECNRAEVRVDAVVATASDQEAVKRLKSEIERKAHSLLEVADIKTLVEILTSISSAAQLVLMLLAAVEGGIIAVKLHGLLSSVTYRGTVLQPLFRAVYDNCGVNSEGCKTALLKLYYYHF